MDSMVSRAFRMLRTTQRGLIWSGVSGLICVVPVRIAVAQTTPPAGTVSLTGGPAVDPDPFLPMRQARGEIALVPPRALAVIPERHVGRRIRMTDVLTAIEPQFDDFSRNAGLSTRISIQIRTREAKIPIFVSKNEATIATVLQLSAGATVELVGILIERGGRYLFLASDIRSSPRPSHTK